MVLYPELQCRRGHEGGALPGFKSISFLEHLENGGQT